MKLPSNAPESTRPSRVVLALASVPLALLAALLPSGWYDSIPRLSDLRIPFSGVALLRLTFAAESVVLAAIAWKNVRFCRIDGLTAGFVPARRDVDFDVTARRAGILLGLITVAGLLLRLRGLDQDLWLDEITPIVDYTRLGAAQIMGSYLRSNNHLLNTLLLKASIGSFGENEWSVRIPAVLFGTLTIPALYWTARVALSRAASLAAALMIATSYHHVFFSQNARGYTAYLFFALLASGLLVWALREDSLWRWALYIAMIVLGSASLLITAFVLAAHSLLLIVIGILLLRCGHAITAYARRTATVLAIAGFLAFQIYAAALPEAYVVITSVYAEPSAGFATFSPEFLVEVVRGLVVGFDSPLFAFVFVALGALGFAALCIYCWPLGVALALPLILTAALLGGRGLASSPRFFLLAVPLAMLAAASGLQAAAGRLLGSRIASPRAALSLIAIAGLGLAFAAGRSLPYYYRTPKQPYRDALRVANERFGTDRIVVVANAAGGFQYYLRRLATADSVRYSYTRSATKFDSLTSVGAGANPQVLTTFSRALGMELPEIANRLSRDWQADTVLSATVGDGEITVWSRRPTTAPRAGQ